MKNNNNNESDINRLLTCATEAHDADGVNPSFVRGHFVVDLDYVAPDPVQQPHLQTQLLHRELFAFAVIHDGFREDTRLLDVHALVIPTRDRVDDVAVIVHQLLLGVNRQQRQDLMVVRLE